MLTHAELAAYVADADGPELLEFAARVTAWRLTLQGTEYDESRQLVIRCLVAVSNGFADREWSATDSNGSQMDPASPWGRAHARAKVLLADLTPERARKQIAAWANVVRLLAA